MILLIQLFIAHLLGDFFLQPTKWVKHKEANTWRSPFVYFHVVVHFVLILFVTQSVDLWALALFIAACHLVIDIAKLVLQRERTKRRWFFIDQGAHILVLFAAYAATTNLTIDSYLFQQKNVLVTSALFLTILRPTSYIIKMIISKWSPQNLLGENPESLRQAGEYIGYLERLLIVIFILIQQWEGVGFLLAAKSVFRFGDLKESKEMKMTEYVLIGTLLSFTVAVVAGLAATWLLH